MTHVARRIFEGASPRLVALVGVLAAAVLAAQGALVYIAVDQVDRGDLAEFARRLAPPNIGSESGPPLRLDATPTPAALPATPDVDGSSRIAEAPAVTIPGEVELILAAGPELPAGPPAPPPPSQDAAGAEGPAGPASGEPAPGEAAPSGEDVEEAPPGTRRLSNPDDDDGDEREDLASADPSPRQAPGDGREDDSRRGRPDDHPANRCDDERVDHHDHGDEHGVDCDEAEGEYRSGSRSRAQDPESDHGNRKRRGTDGGDAPEGPERGSDASDRDRDDHQERDRSERRDGHEGDHEGRRGGGDGEDGGRGEGRGGRSGD